VDAYLAKNPLAPAVGAGHGHTPGE
jgi:hypothetical protein